MDNFNPRSLAGATDTFKKCCYTIKISIHAPSRERHAGVGILSPPLYFNPRSLAGTTKGYRLIKMEAGISIHAPSWERPFCGIELDLKAQYISIHAPSRERHASLNHGRTSGGISIHAPSRERPKDKLEKLGIRYISIHAPSRERPVDVPSLLKEM